VQEVWCGGAGGGVYGVVTGGLGGRSLVELPGGLLVGACWGWYGRLSGVLGRESVGDGGLE